MDLELVRINYVAGVMYLALDMSSESLIEMMRGYAEINEYEVAEGYRKALISYLSKGNQYCRVKPHL
jgi:hypothetical protein